MIIYKRYTKNNMQKIYYASALLSLILINFPSFASTKSTQFISSATHPIYCYTAHVKSVQDNQNTKHSERSIYPIQETAQLGLSD